MAFEYFPSRVVYRPHLTAPWLCKWDIYTELPSNLNNCFELSQLPTYTPPPLSEGLFFKILDYQRTIQLVLLAGASTTTVTAVRWKDVQKISHIKVR